jgi:hypothetical protein
MNQTIADDILQAKTAPDHRIFIKGMAAALLLMDRAKSRGATADLQRFEDMIRDARRKGLL